MKKSVQFFFSLAIAVVCIFGNTSQSGLSGNDVQQSARYPFANLFALTTSAEAEGIYQYTIADGKATITKCDETASGNIIIPSKLGGAPVTTIGLRAFIECSNITGITIPGSVTVLEYGAFTRCVKLSSITIPNSVKTISVASFEGCSSLTSIKLPNSISRIENGVFMACGLTSITIPNGVTRIDEFAFQWCRDLVSVVIPSSVSFIDGYAFQDCESLTNVNIPYGLQSIRGSTFINCKSLKQISIPSSVKVIEQGAFYGCTGLTNIDIPSGVTTIADDVFYNCTGLKSIYIPASVSSIGERTFIGVDNLTIYGPADSYAQAYAGIFSIPFIPKAEPATNPPVTTVRPSTTKANKPGTTQTASDITETANSSDITAIVPESITSESINSESQSLTTEGQNGDLSETGKPSLKRVLVIVLPVCGLLGIGSVAAYIIIKRKKI